jgi:Flp pilus assembly secretin CpaC
VTVSVFRGDVALSGFVSTQDQKQEAVKIAQRANGVQHVEDQMVIRSNPTAPIVGEANQQNQNNNSPGQHQ